MSPCPSCGSIAIYHTVPICPGCAPIVCPTCFHGMRYCCRAHLPPPPPVTRELSESKWEFAEEIMADNPELSECIVYRIPNRHIYKLVRDGMRIIRIHITLGG